MRTRIASAAVIVPLVLATLYVGGSAWILGVAALAAVGGHEMEAMALRLDRRPTPHLAPAAAAGVVAAAGYFGFSASFHVLTAAVVVAFVDQLRRDEAERALVDWALGVAAAAYVGLLLAYLAVLRGLPDGALWTTVLLLLVWANDSAAYVAGRMFGRTPFAPSISPKKTWEGFAAGVAASVLVGGALWVGAITIRASFWTAPPGYVPISPYPPLWAMAGLGLAVAVAGPLGDLAKSFVKRQVGVKDAGTLIPGHGGVLDRMDSLMFAGPVVYWAAVAFGGVA